LIISLRGFRLIQYQPCVTQRHEGCEGLALVMTTTAILEHLLEEPLSLLGSTVADLQEPELYCCPTRSLAIACLAEPLDRLLKQSTGFVAITQPRSDSAEGQDRVRMGRLLRELGEE